MYAITVEFRVKPRHREAFREAMLQQAANSLAREPGCHHFDVCVAGDDPGHVFLYELYSDRAAFERHLESEHFKDFDARTRDWIDGKAVSGWQRLEPA